MTFKQYRERKLDEGVTSETDILLTYIAYIEGYQDGMKDMYKTISETK